MLTADMPPTAADIVHMDYAEQGFFSQKLDVKGIPVKANACVYDKALVEAGKRVWSQVHNQPCIIVNMTRAGAELHIIGRNQVTSDLPYLREYRGKPYDGNLTIDERTRGVGGLQASCGEENLLKLKEDRYKGSDICRHEFAHTILTYGVDDSTRKMVIAQYEKAMSEGKWKTAYAATNYHEYFAELTMWYFGSRGYYGKIEPKPQEGPAWLKSYDPGGYDMVDKIYSGRWKVGYAKKEPEKESNDDSKEDDH